MSLNLADCLYLQALENPGSVALRCGEQAYTYGEVHGAAMRVASLLTARGVGLGDRVGLMLPNVPQFPMVLYGALYAGAAVVMMNPLLRAREIAHILDDAKPQAVFVWEDLAEEAIKAREEGGADLLPVGPREDFAGADAYFEPVPASPDDVAAILYTAATSGRPMGAQLTHFNLFQNASTVQHRMLHYTPDDVCLAALPLYHGYGLTNTLNAAFLAGSQVVLVPRFDAPKLLQLMEQQRVTVSALVPTMMELLLRVPQDRVFDLSALRLTIGGGAPVPPSLTRRMRERFGLEVREGYGLSETGPSVSINPPGDGNKPGSVGRPLWGVELRIVDEKRQALPAGQVGEVLVRGHSVMLGYLNQPEATAAVLRDGWLHTGDLGYLDEDGYLFLTGLKKRMFLVGGLNVYPAEVEEVLRLHEMVADCAVAGIAHPVRGTEVRAFVRPVPGQCIEPDVLSAHCRTHLTAYKCPRRFLMVDSIPRLADGSPDVTALLGET